MFGKILYYDKKTIDEYMALIKNKKQVKIEEYEIEKNQGVELDTKVLSANTRTNKKHKGIIVDNYLYDCNQFEKELSNRDDYFDFTESADYELTNVPRGSIIKIEAFIEIPENFDIMKIIDTFKPLLRDSVKEKSGETVNEKILDIFFGSTEATKIPIIADADEGLMCGKLNEDNLIVAYEELEELDEPIILLARVSSGVVDKEKPYYDPLKDFIPMNRTMRRTIKDRGKELEPLFAENDYQRIEILAIYR